ncbi:MAG: hypothetical protein COA88_11695 [Kordia sp.]|nr:MAG: hypothetical protein COA88_11695 [Kordia sp.]
MLRKTALLIFMLISFFSFTQESIHQLKQQLSEASNLIEKSEVLLNICDAYFASKKNTDSIFSYTKQLKDIALKTSDNILLAKTYHKNARAYYLSANHESAQKNGEKAIELYHQNKLFTEAALVQRTLGWTNLSLYNNKRALNYFLEAKKHLPEEEKIIVYTGIGTTYIQTNNLEQAVHYFNLAKETSENLNLEHYDYNIHSGLAQAYAKNKNYLEAISHYQKALNYTLKKKDYLGQSVCYHNLGAMNISLNNYPKAKQHYETAMLLFDEISHTYIKASTYLSYSETLLHLGLLQNTETYLKKAENLLISINHTVLVPDILNLKAKIYRTKGNLPKAVSYLHKAIAHSKSNKNEITDFTEESYFELSEIYEELNNPKKALTAYKNFSMIKDSISDRLKSSELETLKIKHDISNYEQQLNFKNQELLSAKAKRNMSYYRNVLLGVLLLGLTFFIFRQRKLNNINKKTMLTENQVVKLKETQLHTEMKHKNNQITEYAIHINERNRFQNTCVDRIKNIKKEAKHKETKDLLTNLQFYINENITVNNEKIALNKRAKGTEDSFVFGLKNQYPKLTTKEIKVATYLVLELPSKSIANQMGINQQSVNNYRFSIRKKLALSKNDNLVAFLRTIQ